MFERLHTKQPKRMFASGLLRDRRDLQKQMRQDALCFTGNRNNTVETSTTSKQLPSQPTITVPLPQPSAVRSSLSNKKLLPPNE